MWDSDAWVDSALFFSTLKQATTECWIAFSSPLLCIRKKTTKRPSVSKKYFLRSVLPKNIVNLKNNSIKSTILTRKYTKKTISQKTLVGKAAKSWIAFCVLFMSPQKNSSRKKKHSVTFWPYTELLKSNFWPLCEIKKTPMFVVLRFLTRLKKYFSWT